MLIETYFRNLIILDSAQTDTTKTCNCFKTNKFNQRKG